MGTEGRPYDPRIDPALTQLERRRVELATRRRRLQLELAELDRGLADIDEQLQTLRRLPPATAAHGPAAASGAPQPLQGPEIRETAVAVLRARERPEAPIHYRALLELLRGAGYVIVGKKPEATLLTQLSRSPVVRRTSAPGTYVLDLDAPAQLRARIDQLRRLLHEARMQADRQRLMGELRTARRALEEAEAVLA